MILRIILGGRTVATHTIQPERLTAAIQLARVYLTEFDRVAVVTDEGNLTTIVWRH